MIVSLHQPAYLPWLGYLEKVSRADIFVFLDNVQFGGKKDNFVNRNKIKTPQGAQWLTVPVKLHGHSGALLGQVSIDDTQPWRTKHLKSIEMNYRKSRYFKECFPKLEQLMENSEAGMVSLLWHQLNFWLEEFEIETKILRASQLSVVGTKSALVLDICEQLGATHYLSGPMGLDYLDADAFAASAIEIIYQRFDHPTYPQLWGDFEPFMCIVDYWMNCGPGPLNFLKRESYGV